MYDGVDASLLANDGRVLVIIHDNSIVFGDAIIFSTLFPLSHALISLNFLMKIRIKKFVGGKPIFTMMCNLHSKMAIKVIFLQHWSYMVIF
jgi:hypothetical protein